MVKKAVILCGGMATRFLPISKSIPKEMLPILDTPVVGRIVNELNDVGVEECLIIIGRNKECLVNYFDRNTEMEQRLKSKKNFAQLKRENTLGHMQICFKRQVNAKGTGHAISLAQNFVGKDPFILMFGDEVVFHENSYAQQLIDVFEKYNQNVVAVKKVDRKECFKYGMMKINENGTLNEIVEKPKLENCPSDICYLGGAVFTHDIMKCIKAICNTQKAILKKQFKCSKCMINENYYAVGKKEITEISITDAINLLAKNNTVRLAEIKGMRVDVGNAVGFVEANIYAGLHSKHKKEILEFIETETKK